LIFIIILQTVSETMNSDILHIAVYVITGGILGTIIILAATKFVPGIVDKLTPNIDEQKEIVRGNQAIAQFYGMVCGAVIIGISIVVAAAVLGGIQSGAGILKPINLTPQIYTPVYTNAPAVIDPNKSN
jgi:hypothetical protein